MIPYKPFQNNICIHSIKFFTVAQVITAGIAGVCVGTIPVRANCYIRAYHYASAMHAGSRAGENGIMTNLN